MFTACRRPGQSGLVASLNRPGGNATGINASLVPSLSGEAARIAARADARMPTRVAVLVNPSVRDTESIVKTANEAAVALGRSLIVVDRSMQSARSTRPSRHSLNERPDASHRHCRPVLQQPARTNRRAWRRAMQCPRSTESREFVEAGGLMSYGAALPMRIAGRRSTSAASSRVRSRPTCRFSSRPSSSSSST